MRFFFLFILFCLLIGESVAEEKECKFTEVDEYVDEAFLNKYGKCTKWTGRNTSVWIDHDSIMPEAQTNKALSTVKTITGFENIGIKDSTYMHLIFANLTSVKGLDQLQVINNTFLETVSFPKLTKLVVNTVFIRNVPRLKATSIEAILKVTGKKRVWFEQACHAVSTISEASAIPSNCRFLHSLDIAKDTTGTVNASINYIGGELTIVDTKLDNLDFLQLDQLKEKLNNTCMITGNTFIYYNENALNKMINEVYKKCTIGNNTGNPSTTTTTTPTLATTTSIAIKQVRFPAEESSVRIASSLCSIIIAFSVYVSL